MARNAALFGFALVSALTACGQSSYVNQETTTLNNSANDSDLSRTLEPTALSPEPPSMPPATHLYDEKDGDVYYYVAAVSEEDQKKGKAAGDVVPYRYLGKNGKDEYILATIDDSGNIITRDYCKNPCKVIRRDNGSHLAFSDTSVIGAAFTDAFNGFLKDSSRHHKRDLVSGQKTTNNSSSSPAAGEPQQ